MSGGPRPPVPGLIPLAALSRRPARPRRRPESIDVGARSRGIETTRAAAPGRRRHHRRRSSAAVGKQSRSSSPALDRPPRVNPIFVWVRQEDTRIVDVKCEDYDKRNRILLTKTAHGWRAIPRTETLGAPRASAEFSQNSPSPPPVATHHGHHHRHHHKKRRRSKSEFKSTSVQFPEAEPNVEPSWVTSENVNIESLLPSHTIHVKRTPSSEGSPSVNSVHEQEFARTSPECSTPDKVCDVSPLENLLAVAELELKQHIQSGNWDTDTQERAELVKDVNESDNPSIEEIDELLKSKAGELQIEQIDLSDEDRKSQGCSYNDEEDMCMNDILSRLEQSLQSPQGFSSENNFNDDITTNDVKLESLLDEPHSDCNNISEEHQFNCQNDMEEHVDNMKANNLIQPVLDNFKETISFENETNIDKEQTVETTDCHKTSASDPQELIENQIITKNLLEFSNDLKGNTLKYNTDEKLELPIYKSMPQDIEQKVDSSTEPKNNLVNKEESVMNKEEILPPIQIHIEEELPLCLDLSVKKKPNLALKINTEPEVNSPTDNVEGPTDLTIRKIQCSPKPNPPRPPSQSSETIQSPQPSGIPAVPPSPDIVSTTTATIKPRSVFLESLLASAVYKMPTNPENSPIKHKEPLDLGNRRKSASPTVTCSEEIVTPCSDSEPPLKKLKPNEITLKTLLDREVIKPDSSEKSTSKEASNLPDTSGLLGLLKATSETPDPLTEYKQLLKVTTERSDPLTEYTKLLKASTNNQDQLTDYKQLLKVATETSDPVNEFKQLLLEIDVPNPLMVPKDCFSDLLKHPRREILKILTGHSNKNVPLDDILVVYKNKLLAAIEANVNSTSKDLPVEKSVKGNKPVEKNSAATEKPVPITSKRKSTETTNKSLNITPDTSAKSILANNIDAANEAALNPLFWASCPNPFEAMANYPNNAEFLQALYAASSMPYLPSQLGDLHPGLQMILGNKMMPPVGIPSLPGVPFTNPLELSMWQEAMLQASLLRSKNPYENPMLNQPNYRSEMEPKRAQMQQNHSSSHHSRLSSNNHNKNSSQNHQALQQQQQQSVLQGLYGQSVFGNQLNWPNHYLGMTGVPQGNDGTNMLQFNPFSHKNNATNKHNQQLSPTYLQKQNREALLAQFNEQEKRLHQQMIQEKQKIQHQKLLRQQQQMMKQNSNKQLPSPSSKMPFSINPFVSNRDTVDIQRHLGLPVPIDLSGYESMRSSGRTNAGNSRNSSCTVTSTKGAQDDVPEVGSTTGSIEEMQEAQAHLWHPLFGSNNRGPSPWNLPPLTATGE